MCDAQRIVGMGDGPAASAPEGAPVTGPAKYLSWGWLSISVPNLVVISVMIVLFLLAVLVPFIRDRGKS